MPGVDTSSQRLHMEIAAALRWDIREHRYQPGDKLPLYRDLQKRFGVANNTIRSALKVLAEEGIIHTVHGKGSFVADPSPAIREQLSTNQDLLNTIFLMAQRIEDLARRVALLEAEITSGATS